MDCSCFDLAFYYPSNFHWGHYLNTEAAIRVCSSKKFILKILTKSSKYLRGNVLIGISKDVAKF